MPNLTSHTVQESNQDTWRILFVDDEDSVQKNAHLVLDNYIYDRKPVTLFSAYSVEQAISLLQQQPHFAVLFLDMVMETYDASLHLVRYVRETLNNHFVRIILCTDQSDCALEKEVILRYEVNDYVNKNDLNRPKLLILTIASLRTYSNLMLCESSRQTLEVEVFELHQALIYEFLGPLSGIQGLAQMIYIALEEGESTEQAIMEIIDFARIIEGSSHHIYEVIKNLLDLKSIK